MGAGLGADRAEMPRVLVDTCGSARRLIFPDVPTSSKRFTSKKSAGYCVRRKTLTDERLCLCYHRVRHHRCGQKWILRALQRGSTDKRNEFVFLIV